MQLPSLVTSVPDLHTARILAASGVPYLVFSLDTENLADLIQWLEGPRIGVEIADPEAIVPRADFLLIPLEFYDRFAFVEKPVFWKTEDTGAAFPDGMVYTRYDVGSARDGVMCFYPYADMPIGNDLHTWLDCREDKALLEALFLSGEGG